MSMSSRRRCGSANVPLQKEQPRGETKKRNRIAINHHPYPYPALQLRTFKITVSLKTGFDLPSGYFL